MRSCLFFLALFAVGCGGSTPPPTTGSTPPPPPGIRYVVGGDSRDDTSHVLPWAFREAKARGASAFLFLGDMEISPQFDPHFAKELPLLDPVPFYPVLGNHEVRIMGFLALGLNHAEKEFRKRFFGNARTPVASSIPNRVVYSVTLPGGFHFIALDNVSQNGFGKAQMDWLASDLESARADQSVHHIAVGMHKPLANNGVTPHSMEHDGPEAVKDSDDALALFQKYRVSLILASHVHEYASFTQGGIPAYITGGLGAPLTRSGPEHAFHHFLLLEVKDEGVKVELVRFTGEPTIGDAEDGD